MKIKYIGEKCISLTPGKVYEVLDVRYGTYQIKDDTDDTYYFGPDSFEVVEEN